MHQISTFNSQIPTYRQCIGQHQQNPFVSGQEITTLATRIVSQSGRCPNRLDDKSSVFLFGLLIFSVFPTSTSARSAPNRGASQPAGDPNTLQLGQKIRDVRERKEFGSNQVQPQVRHQIPSAAPRLRHQHARANQHQLAIQHSQSQACSGGQSRRPASCPQLPSRVANKAVGQALFQPSTSVRRPLSHRLEPNVPVRQDQRIAPKPLRFRQFQLGGNTISAFSHQYLRQINPTRKIIFDGASNNMFMMIRAAEREIKTMQLFDIVKWVYAKFDLCISQYEAEQMRFDILRLRSMVEKYMKGRNHFLFFSEHDHGSAIGIYSKDNIFISDKFFSKAPILQAFILIHELTHAIGKKDNFYFNSNIVKENGVAIRSMIDFPIKQAFSVFLRGMYQQMQRKSVDVNNRKYFSSNADTLALSVFSLFEAGVRNTNRLRDMRRLVLSDENRRSFPSRLNRT